MSALAFRDDSPKLRQVALDRRLDDLRMRMGRPDCVCKPYRVAGVGEWLATNSTSRQSALARRICSGVCAFTSINVGLQTRIAIPCAREIATFRRWRLYRKSIPRGASAGLE